MREHPSGHFYFLTYDPVHKTIPYGGIKDELELRKKLAMARESAALREERTNKQKTSKSIQDYVHWIESELQMEDDGSVLAADQACLARYPDGTFRPSGKEIQPSPQQALLWKNVRKLKSHEESRKSQDIESMQVRARRLKRNFETRRRRAQSDHRVKRLEEDEEVIMGYRDDDDSAEHTSTTAILKDLGMLPCGKISSGLSMTSTLASTEYTAIELLNTKKSIDMFGPCSPFQLQDRSSKCRPVPQERPESTRNTIVTILGLEEHSDACPVKANLLDDELESSTKLCIGLGINRWLICRNPSNR